MSRDSSCTSLSRREEIELTFDILGGSVFGGFICSSSTFTIMPLYRVNVTYDMGMSSGSETYAFEAKNDKKARAYCKKNQGKHLALLKRDVHFNMDTLSRVLE